MILKLKGRLVGVGIWTVAAMICLVPTHVPAQSFPPQPSPTYQSSTPAYSPSAPLNIRRHVRIGKNLSIRQPLSIRHRRNTPLQHQTLIRASTMVIRTPIYQRNSEAARILSLAATAWHDHHRSEERHLYLIQDQNHALRYGIRVGRDGLTWEIFPDSPQSRMAVLVPAAGNDRVEALTCRALWPAVLAIPRRPRHVSRQYRLSYPRHQRAGRLLARRFRCRVLLPDLR